MAGKTLRKQLMCTAVCLVAAILALVSAGCTIQFLDFGSWALDGLESVHGGVPDTEYCADVSTWNEISVRYENEVLTLVNQYRAEGADCGSEGEFAPADPLTSNEALRCAARKHSLDMGENGFFDHVNLENEDPYDRITAAGYQGYTWGENIAYGSITPAQVVQGWINSPGHCANIMRPSFTEIGVGHYLATNHWTTNFGAE